MTSQNLGERLKGFHTQSSINLLGIELKDRHFEIVTLQSRIHARLNYLLTVKVVKDGLNIT